LNDTALNDAALNDASRTTLNQEKTMTASNTAAADVAAYVKSAEAAARNIPGVTAATPRRAIARVGVIGAGTMGGGITMNFLNAGIPVTLIETKQEALDRGVATMRRNYDNTVKKGRLTAAEVDTRMALVTPSLDMAALAGADLIIEAVFEEMGVKETVFRKLDAVARPGAILATNTSTLDVDRIASFTARPGDVIGMHFFSPANVMKLLEIVRGKATTADVLATVMDLSVKIGKTGVVVGVCDGFVGNRMLEQYSRVAGFLLEEGCTPAQVDGAIEKWGFAMGPFRMIDMAGNDIAWAIRKRRYVEHPEFTYSKTGDLLCELGRLGQKTSAGWYDYKPGDRVAYPSPVVAEMLERHARGLGVAKRAVSDEEIVDRLLFSLANEGARILEEGIAARASDIDTIYFSGYGFPAAQGGPMFHVNRTGLARVKARIEEFSRGHHGEAWEVAPLLATLAASGGSFA